MEWLSPIELELEVIHWMTNRINLNSIDSIDNNSKKYPRTNEYT